MAQNKNTEKTDILGIISLVMAFMSLQIPGLILGIIGVKKAKKEGRNPIISKIGWIVNLIMIGMFVVIIGLFFALIPKHLTVSNDLSRKADLGYFSGKLEEFHTKNGYYPSTLDQFTTSSIDTKDPAGIPYTYTPAPDGCTYCTSYTISTYLENASAGTKLYQVSSQLH